jgi:hypothetical protein
MPEGDLYEVRVLVHETSGRITVSQPLDLSVRNHGLAPELHLLSAPLVPAGEVLPVVVEAAAMGGLLSLECVAEGPVAGEETFWVLNPEPGLAFISQQLRIPVRPDAKAGERVVLRVKAMGRNGKSREAVLEVPVGIWGENQVVVQGHQEVGPEMAFADLLVPSGAVLDWNRADIPVHGITLEDGGLMRISEDQENLHSLRVREGGRVLLESGQQRLKVRNTLTVEAGGLLEVTSVNSNKRDAYGAYGGAHGGDSGSRQAHGDFRDPAFPGGTSRYQYGGGVLRLEADTLILDGRIQAHGQDAFSGSWYVGGGAGGSIRADVRMLEGSGSLSVRGGNAASASQGPGAGGRIALYYESFAGGGDPLDRLTLDAKPGRALSMNYASAPGTIYLKAGHESHGTLMVDGRDLDFMDRKTPIRALAPIKVEEIEALGNGAYRVWLEKSPGVPSPDPANWELGLTGTRLVLNAEDSASPEADIENHGVSSNGRYWLDVRSEANLLPHAGGKALGLVRLDRLILKGKVRLACPGRMESSLVSLETASQVTDVTELLGPDTHLDTLNLKDTSGFYPGALFVRSLSLENADLRTSGPMEVEGEILIRGTSRMENSLIRADTFRVVSGGEIRLSGSLNVRGNFILGGENTRMRADTIRVGGNGLISRARLTTSLFSVEGNLDLLEGAILTVPDAEEATGRLWPLDLKVGETLFVEESAKISLTAKGYPRGFIGSDFIYNTALAGSHGGLRAGLGCGKNTLGDFRRAPFAGSGSGGYGNGRGGGLARIEAGSFSLYGNLEADGENGGAGGGIDLVLDQGFEGSGLLSAAGGRSSDSYAGSYPSGGGGRIRLILPHGNAMAFGGTFRLGGGAYDGWRNVGGAGTLFITDSEGKESRLVVDNGGNVAGPCSTPAAQVGRHTLVRVEALGEGLYILHTAQPGPWSGRDLQGLRLTLDAEENAGPDGAYPLVVSNTEDSLTIRVEAGMNLNPEAFTGRDLLGVHVLDRLEVTGKAALSFGEDRVYVRDRADSLLEPGASIEAGEGSVLPESNPEH